MWKSKFLKLHEGSYVETTLRPQFSKELNILGIRMLARMCAKDFGVGFGLLPIWSENVIDRSKPAEKAQRTISWLLENTWRRGKWRPDVGNKPMH